MSITRYFIDNEGSCFGYDDETQQFLIDRALSNNWKEIYKSPETNISPLSADIIKTRINLLIQDTMDNLANSWGYFSITSAVSYVSSTEPQYAADAAALNIWRDQVWSWFYGEISNITVNTDPQTFILNMPSPPEKPVV